jgi:uncharacterized SAM-binding protein YcdF (DUF218 family)
VKRVIVVLLAAWAAVAVALFVVRHEDRPAHADAVVVLSGARPRLPVGLRLVHEHYAPLLVVSRGHSAPLEARVCARREHVLCFDAHPYSTRGEARQIGRLARSRGWRRIDVVTSHFHVFRARMLLRRCYDGDVRMIGAPQSDWKLPFDSALESAKLVRALTFERGC